MSISILVVESGRLFTDLLKQHETTREWQIYHTCILKEIRQLLKGHTINVILLNLLELKRNGIMLFKKIRKSSVPVIIINSGKQLQLSIEGMKLGAFDDFLMPLNLEALITRIHDASKSKIKASSKFPLIERVEKALIAATFAEAGEAEMAKSFLQNKNVI